MFLLTGKVCLRRIIAVLNDILNVSLMKGGRHMKQYQGFLVDDDLNIYSARTKRKLTPHVGSDGYLQVSYRIL